jgi:F-type H+-transporting ATPase subunit alpha
VGGNAQIKAMKKVAGRLRLDLAQYRELEAFAQFGSDLDATTQAQLARGERTVEVLKQGQYQPMAVENQVSVIFAATQGHVDEVEVRHLKRWEHGFHEFLGTQHEEVLSDLREAGELTDNITTELIEVIEEYNKIFAAEVEAEAPAEAATAQAAP